ncbi:acyl-CoA thioesterase [Salibacterium sp. K-3]
MYEIKVRWGDTDPAAIVFYPNFYRWMDEAAHEWFEAAGCPVTKLQQEENIIVPLLEAFCQFKIPLVHEDRVSVYSTVTEVRSKTFKIEHQFFKGDKLAAEGYERRAWTSTAAGVPTAVPIPDYMREKMQGPV